MESSSTTVAPITLFACSGASDLGQLTDLAARRVRASGAASMGCLAALGAVRPEKLKAAKAGRVVAVDGCELDCAMHIMTNQGIVPMTHLCLTDLGLKKGETGVGEAATERVTQALRDAINQ